MPIFDRIKYDPSDDTELCWKFPSEEIVLGSQLIVQSTQEAIFRRNGQNVDFFSAGSHTLSTSNLPILNTIVKLPFGGKTPFAAEVWFVNKTPKRDLKWGTTSPIPLIDPKFGVPVNVRAFGQWGIEIIDSIKFLEQMVGARKFAETDQIYEYFRGELIQDASEIISNAISTGSLSIFNINAALSNISLLVSDSFGARLAKYGIALTNLSFDRINIPQEESEKIQAIMLKRMEAEQLGAIKVADSFKTIKTLDILNEAAKNEGGGILPIITQVGLGGGLASSVASQIVPENQVNLSIEDKLRKLKSMFDAGLINENEYETKKAKLLEDF
jgi:membrane protease subunit (stomatin/prohibitin family)